MIWLLLINSMVRICIHQNSTSSNPARRHHSHQQFVVCKYQSGRYVLVGCSPLFRLALKCTWLTQLKWKDLGSPIWSAHRYRLTIDPCITSVRVLTMSGGKYLSVLLNPAPLDLHSWIQFVTAPSFFPSSISESHILIFNEPCSILCSSHSHI